MNKSEKLVQEFRQKDIERWRSLDFVLGYEIKRSNSCDVNCQLCKYGEGAYPKDFNWNGWHDECKCFIVPIQVPKDVFLDFIDFDKNKKHNYLITNGIKSIPEQFLIFIKNDIQHFMSEYWYLNNKKYFK